MSSSSIALADYRAALTAPGALVPALASALARLPIAMTTLAVLLYTQNTTGSYAIAALVSAGALAGESLGAVGQGRLMDRVGPTRPLLLAALLYAGAGTVLIVAIEADAPLAILVGAAALSGLVRPAMPGASRALWAQLVPAGPQRDAAYGYEAISLEVFFILGPALAAILVTAPWPGTGLAAAMTGMVVGTTIFALSRPVRAQRPAAAGPSIGMLGALARPGMRTVALASLGFGLVIGSVEVGVPAGTSTEAFGWVVTAAVLGISAGQVMSGLAVDLAGPPSAFLVGGIAGAVVAAVLWTRRATLAPTPREQLTPAA